MIPGWWGLMSQVKPAMKKKSRGGGRENFVRLVGGHFLSQNLKKRAST